MESATPTLADLLAEDLDVLFCGINPALSAARSGHHFSNASNRFWRVLHQAGFTPHLIRPEDDRTILHYGHGLTAAVGRPTVKASQVARGEFQASADALREKVRRFRPRYLVFLGKPAFSALFQQKNVSWGRQDIRFEGAEIWVLPNPSGLNRSFTLEALVTAYRELHTALRESSIENRRRERI
ncbi:G/U mismatch-specific uracil-DNA glycosylase [Granulicella pectinivorans]|jgi:TDG/mug DNA glycosylase family protein|uniref:G/U mismatch-specific uracil-DNA glycosylase n=1 Tax=Granulicella pectinivorans TaxID=474950 RepID=A0A1I6LFU6_9BACT|nr:G/U mismatch-specific DNA glycosylase [Granulicella pectinivorans]SFS02283.1 G/U mismatch-specific uracil-DNA glycosylase [Granulicella pectinivorans]